MNVLQTHSKHTYRHCRRRHRCQSADGQSNEWCWWPAIGSALKNTYAGKLLYGLQFATAVIKKSLYKKINHTYFVVVFVFFWLNKRSTTISQKKTTDRRLRLYNACITFNIQVLLIIFWMYAGRGGLLTSQTQLNSP